MVELELEAKSWRLVEPGEKRVSNSLSAVEVLMMEVSAVRTEGSVKSMDEGSPPDAKALRMADMFTMPGVLSDPLVASWARLEGGWCHVRKECNAVDKVTRC